MGKSPFVPSYYSQTGNIPAAKSGHSVPLELQACITRLQVFCIVM